MNINVRQAYNSAAATDRLLPMVKSGRLMLRASRNGAKLGLDISAVRAGIGAHRSCFAFHCISFLPVWLKCERPQRQSNALVERAHERRKPAWSQSSFRFE